MIRAQWYIELNAEVYYVYLITFLSSLVIYQRLGQIENLYTTQEESETHQSFRPLDILYTHVILVLLLLMEHFAHILLL